MIGSHRSPRARDLHAEGRDLSERPSGAVMDRAGGRVPPGWDERPCPELGVDTFFRGDDEPAREWARREAMALRVCAACPVRVWCLAEALALGDVEGVRGGLPGELRARLLEVVDVAVVAPAVGRAAA